jgi:hypothetical protein
MSRINRGEVPARLENVRRRFEDWRQGHRARSRIPESLWASAVELGRAYGINRTARALRLDYYSLKKRVETVRPATTGHKTAVSSDDPEGPALATFVEVAALPSAIAGECILELEDAVGAKMRIHLKGHEMPDLTALARIFWSVPS